MGEIGKREVKELIAKGIENVPEPYLIEVLDFIRFVETKALERKMELALASETSLKRIGWNLRRTKHGKICKRKCNSSLFSLL